MSPRQSYLKRVLDDLLLRLTLYWVSPGWRPEWTIRKGTRLKESNREAVEELLDKRD